MASAACVCWLHAGSVAHSKALRVAPAGIGGWGGIRFLVGWFNADRASGDKDPHWWQAGAGYLLVWGGTRCHGNTGKYLPTTPKHTAKTSKCASKVCFFFRHSGGMRVRLKWNNPYSSVYDGNRLDSITSQNAAGDADPAQRPGILSKWFA